MEFAHHIVDVTLRQIIERAQTEAPLVNQLARLARPFPSRFVKAKPGKYAADYVSHAVVSQALLAIVGPYDFEVVEVVRNADGVVEGCLATLSCVIDDRITVITEVGDVTGQEDTEGARLKNAASDALKRAAMRLGLGLHLWAGDDYVLADQLAKKSASVDVPVFTGDIDE